MPSTLMTAPAHAPAPTGQTEEPSWPTLLFVDADAGLTRTLVCHFERRGYHVAAAATLAEARDLLERRRQWSLVIADCHLPDGTAWELESWLHDQGRRLPLLLLSRNPRAGAAYGDAGFLAKPFSLARIEAWVNRLSVK